MAPFTPFSPFPVPVPGAPEVDAAPRAGTVVRPLSDAARALLHADDPQWAVRRAPPSPSDLAVNRAGRAWLAALPPAHWPGALARTHPRIVNQLALAWPDRSLTERTFARLLADERGGRRGFPPDVLSELLALRRLRAEQARTAEAPARTWTVAPPDAAPPVPSGFATPR